MKKQMNGAKVKSYTRDNLTITFDLNICEHSAHCTKALPNVFDITKKPWINPEGAEIEEIIETINKCPSGALRYSLD